MRLLIEAAISWVQRGCTALPVPSASTFRHPEKPEDQGVDSADFLTEREARRLDSVSFRRWGSENVRLAFGVRINVSFGTTHVDRWPGTRRRSLHDACNAAS